MSQGFYAALRLVSVCQLGKDPSLAVMTLSDPPPRLVGIDSSTIAGFAHKKWTIEVAGVMVHGLHVLVMMSPFPLLLIHMYLHSQRNV